LWQLLIVVIDPKMIIFFFLHVFDAPLFALPLKIQFKNAI